MFDGRLSDAALRLARAADARGIPILVEAERVRPGLDELLSLATTVVTSQNFPQEFVGLIHNRFFADALVELTRRLPRARLIVTTRGKQGSVALERLAADEAAPYVKHQLELEWMFNQHEIKPESFTCPPAGAPPTPRQTFTSVLRRFSRRDVVRITLAPAASLHPDSVLDTTGAGDAFIGALAVAVHLYGAPLDDALELASYVAAAKCRQTGARAGLPTLDTLPPSLRQAVFGSAP